MDGYQDCKSLVQARRFLRESGLQVNRVRPDGRKSPDFFCTSPNGIWVEVKSIGRQPLIDKLRDAKIKLESSIGIIDLYRIFAKITDDVPSGTLEKLSKLANFGHENKIRPNDVIWCGVTTRSNKGRTHLTRLALLDGTTAVFVYHSDEFKPPIPYFLAEKIVQNQNLTISCLAEKIVQNQNLTISCLANFDEKISYLGFLDQGVLHAFLDMKPITREQQKGCVYSISRMYASRSQYRNQIQNRFREASKQFKSRIQNDQAAVIVFTVVDFAPIEHIFLSAFLGKLKLNFDVYTNNKNKKSKDNDNLFFGEDRQFTDSKNRSISAVAMIDRTNGRAVLLHNPFATNPVTSVNWSARVLFPDIETGEIKILRD